MPTHTLGCYWWFLNDLGLPPSVCNPSLSVVSLEAFLGLTHQVQALAEMIQSIIPHIPQLMQQPTPQQQTSSTTPLEPPPSQGQPLVQWRPNDEVAQLLPELLSGPPRNATDQSLGESSMVRYPFVPEIKDNPILQNFRLLTLEAYYDGSDPVEHVTTFRL
ncbi:hypothetical protein GW17_00057912 [Ensete ventricosum]|nr:hypothetical protein GW17_00057912 [Ensete ventricosum]